MSDFKGIKRLENLARKIVIDYKNDFFTEDSILTHNQFMAAETYFMSMLHAPGVVNVIVDDMIECFKDEIGGVADE